MSYELKIVHLWVWMGVWRSAWGVWRALEGVGMGVWMVWMIWMGFGRGLDGALDRYLEGLWRAGWGLGGVWVGLWRGLEGSGGAWEELDKMFLDIQGLQKCPCASKIAKMRKKIAVLCRGSF